MNIDLHFHPVSFRHHLLLPCLCESGCNGMLIQVWSYTWLHKLELTRTKGTGSLSLFHFRGWAWVGRGMEGLRDRARWGNVVVQKLGATSSFR